MISANDSKDIVSENDERNFNLTVQVAVSLKNSFMKMIASAEIF